MPSEFIESGWSTKALHRLIMLSAVYRQQSHGPEDAELRQRAAGQVVVAHDHVERGLDRDGQPELAHHRGRIRKQQCDGRDQRDGPASKSR